MSSLLLVVLLCHFGIGLGVVTRLKAVRSPYSLLGLAILVGLGVGSVMPLLLELAKIPLHATSLVIGLLAITFLSLWITRSRIAYLKSLFTRRQLRINLYELPFLSFWGYLLFISAWKCAYFPVIPFDTLVGPDLVAQFAVREQTLVSSVFTEHLPRVSIYSNQPFYAPFTALMQLAYRLAGQESELFSFGTLWLTVLVAAFNLFLYAELRQRLHPLLAGTLMALLWCTPELFAYTFLVQTDYANAAFFTASVILLQAYLDTGQRGALLMSMLLMALACWTRTETIFFVPLGSLLLIWKDWHTDKYKTFVRAGFYLLVAAIPILLWNIVFLRLYVPIPLSAGAQIISWHTTDYVSRLLSVYADMNQQVVFHPEHWNYTVPAWLALTAINLLLPKRAQGLTVLFWIIGVYVVFGLIIYHINGANVAFTFRRGFFKLIFLLYFYLSATALLQRLSKRIYHWERNA